MMIFFLEKKEKKKENQEKSMSGRPKRTTRRSSRAPEPAPDSAPATEAESSPPPSHTPPAGQPCTHPLCALIRSAEAVSREEQHQLSERERLRVLLRFMYDTCVFDTMFLYFSILCINAVLLSLLPPHPILIVLNALYACFVLYKLTVTCFFAVYGITRMQMIFAHLEFVSGVILFGGFCVFVLNLGAYFAYMMHQQISDFEITVANTTDVYAVLLQPEEVF